jgi:short-subunit dehydrogenase
MRRERTRDLHGQSVLIIGATGGLGAPIARLLDDRGARLTLVGRDEFRLAELDLPGTAIAVDIRKPGSPQEVVDAAVDAQGRLDAVVVAAGAAAFGPAAETADQTLIDLFTLNTLAPIRLLRAAAPHLVSSAEHGGAAAFLALSAVLAEQPMAGMAAYSASKAALTAFDHAAARELRRDGVRVIDVRPPHTETGLAERPIAGTAPSLPAGLDPSVVAARVVRALESGERDVASTDFDPAQTGDSSSSASAAGSNAGSAARRERVIT